MQIALLPVVRSEANADSRYAASRGSISAGWPLAMGVDHPEAVAHVLPVGPSLAGETMPIGLWSDMGCIAPGTGAREGELRYVGAIQTFGDLIGWHSYVHAIASEALFKRDGFFPFGLSRLIGSGVRKRGGYAGLSYCCGKKTSMSVWCSLCGPGRTRGSASTSQFGLQQTTHRACSGWFRRFGAAPFRWRGLSRLLNKNK